MSKTCNFTTLENGKESILNKKLNEVYPTDILVGVQGKENANKYYNHMRTDEGFLEWFGNWNDPAVRKELIESYPAIFDENGEPRLFEDTDGNTYVKNVHGGWRDLKSVTEGLSPDDIEMIVSGLTANFISNGEVTLGTYIANQFSKGYHAMKTSVDDAYTTISETDDIDYQAVLFDQIAPEELKLKKLSLVHNNPSLQRQLRKSVIARLGTQGFKYTETIEDKEERTDEYNDIVNFKMDSNQESNRALNDPIIMKFLASIPDFKEYFEDISKQKKVRNMNMNTIMSTPMYMNSSHVWGLLESLFADVVPAVSNGTEGSKDIFQNYLLALKQEVEDTEHPGLHYVYDYLSNLEKQKDIEDPQEFATKLSSAFFKSQQHYVITQVETKTDSAGNTKTTYKVIDPATKGNKIAKLSAEYVETALNVSEVSKLNNKYKGKEFNQKYSELKKGLIAEFGKISNNSNDLEFQAFLDKLANKTLNLGIPMEVIKYHIRRRRSERDGLKDLKSDINKFLKASIKSDYISDKIAGIEPKGEIDLLVKLLQEGDAKGKDAFKKRMIADGTFMKELAISGKIFNKDVSETAFVVGGSKRWAYSNMSQTQYEVNRIKNGDLAILENVRDRGFKIIEHLLDEEHGEANRQLLKVVTNSEIKNERDSNAVLHKNIGEIDYHMDNYFKMFNSFDEFYEATTKRLQNVGSKEAIRVAAFNNYLTYNFGADKNSLFSLHGLPNPVNNITDVYNIKDNSLGEGFKVVLDGYVKGELELAKTAGEQINEYMKITDADKKRQYLMDTLVPGYHYKIAKDKATGIPLKNVEHDVLTGDDFSRGSYHSLGIFSRALTEFKTINTFKDLMFVPKLSYPMINPNFLYDDGTGINPDMMAFMSYVYKDMNELIMKNHDYLKDIVVVKRENDKGKVEELGLFDVKTNVKMDPKLMIYKYVIGSFMINYELSNTLNGHIGYYKQSSSDDINLSDFLKRAAAVNGDGKYLRHRDRRAANPEDTSLGKSYRKYNNEKVDIYDADDSIVVGVVNEVDIKRSIHSDLLSQATGEELSFGYELADAQGYATGAHFKDLLTRIYSWTAKDEVIYNRLNDRNHQVNDEDIRWLKTSSKTNTPGKFQYYGLDENGMPVYLKYSVAPLFPAMVAGTDMEVVLNKMEAQGVEQIVFNSGSKASNAAPTTMHKLDENGGYAGINPEMRFNPFLIDSMKLKMQVEMPTKLDKETDLGSQSIKNILANIDINGESLDYTVGKKKFTGKQIYDKVQDVSNSILQYGLDKVLKKIGHDTDADGEFIFDNQKLKKLLLGQMDLETEADLMDLLRSDLPLETIPNFTQRAFPVLGSYLSKTAGKLKTNGGSAVQVANIGYDRLTSKAASSVFFFGEKTELTPPLPETDADGNIKYYNDAGELSTKEAGGKMRIKKAKILMPFTSLFDKTGLSYEEFITLYKSGVIDKKIFNNIMGYRIPNQAMSSNDSFEIVGILPPIAGDQVVVYHEITAKTGSDFDIDKMYFASSNFEVNYEKKFFKKADNFLKNELKYTKKDMIEILDEEGYVSEYEDFNQMKEVFIRAIIFNSETEEGELFASTYGKKVVESVTYSTEGLKGKQNELIELLNSIIESPVSYNDLMSPLDNTELQDTIHEVDYLKSLDPEGRIAHANLKPKEQLKAIGTFTKENREGGMEQLMPVSLVKARVDMLEAKTLVAIMANNMSDIGESQKAGFGLRYNMGIKVNGTMGTLLSRVYAMGKEGNSKEKLTKRISYFMNAAVDAAKDNYIISGNVVSYSANPALIMARLGMPIKDIFTILMNKEVLEISKYKTHQKAKLSDFSSGYAQKDLDQWSKTLLKKMSEKGFDLFEVVSREDFLANNSDKTEDILGFWNLVQTMGKEFNNAVVAMKSDSNSALKNVSEFMAYNNKVERAKQDGMVNSFKKWTEDGLENSYFKDNVEFDPEASKRPGMKMMGTMYNNTVGLMKVLSKKMFLETTPAVMKTTNNILASLGNPLETSAANIALVQNYIYPQLLHNSGHPLYDIDSDAEARLLKEFPKKLQRYKIAHPENGFLKQLVIETSKQRNLVRFPNSKNYAKHDKVGFKKDINAILKDTTDVDVHPEGSMYHNLIDELIQYEFLVTGFKSTHYSFNDMLPATYFVKRDHGRSIEKYIETLNGSDTVISYTDALTLMAKTHHMNYKIVKKIGSKKTGPGPDGRFPNTKSGFKSLERLQLDEDNYAPFFKRGKQLYMLAGKDEDEMPIYKKIKMIQNRDFNTYSFHSIEQGLKPDTMKYISDSSKLYKDHPTADTLDSSIDNPTETC